MHKGWELDVATVARVGGVDVTGLRRVDYVGNSLREVGFDKQLIEKVREQNNTRSLTDSSALYYCVFGGVPYRVFQCQTKKMGKVT